jgi:hypothetical protein
MISRHGGHHCAVNSTAAPLLPTTPIDERDVAGTWPAPAVSMLLDAWGATIGHPAYVTAWVYDNADAFRR